MTVRLVDARRPRRTPEHVLWVLRKSGRFTDARVRATPIGPELRFFVWRAEKMRDEGDLLYSFIFREQAGGARALGEFAETKRLEFIALGWELDEDATAAHIATPIS